MKEYVNSYQFAQTNTNDFLDYSDRSRIKIKMSFKEKPYDNDRRV